ncbi:UNVERIFIED_CONTAM: hypothetical protein K2H54_057018 [Gekko kuhli]
MPLSRPATSLWGRGLAAWLALCVVRGQDSGLPPGEGNRDVKGELSKADGWVVDSDLPTGCILRKLTKRSSPSDVSWLRDLGSREANCQIFPVTTALPRVTPPGVSTRGPGKAATQRTKAAASPEEGPRRLFYFMPYYPQGPHPFYHVLFPIKRGASGYRAVWHYKSLGKDSSEEKRRRRDTLPTSQKRNTISLEG